MQWRCKGVQRWVGRLCGGRTPRLPGGAEWRLAQVWLGGQRQAGQGAGVWGHRKPRVRPVVNICLSEASRVRPVANMCPSEASRVRPVANIRLVPSTPSVERGEGRGMMQNGTWPLEEQAG